MFLSRLNSGFSGGGDVEITGVSADSRAVRTGWLFAALPGTHDDGRAYIGAALTQGAAAVLVPRGTPVPQGVRVIESDDVARDFSFIVARFYQRQPAHIAAITGTNGKTSTAQFTQQILTRSGFAAASMGTLGVRGHITRAGSMTTPDPAGLHAMLAEMAKEGVTHLAMEASSHGLAQRRIDAVDIGAAGFTNLTRDHLDYHADMETYFAAKARLFAVVMRDDGVAVLNADVPEYERLRAICAGRGIAVHGYGGVTGTDLRLVARTPLPAGQAVTLEVFGHTTEVILPLVGSFMVMNALCALGLATAVAGRDIDPASLSGLEGAPGRLQKVPGMHDARGAIYIDYAHTPDALENVLRALRPHTTGRLICVFGCGGDRDPGKRPIMGGIAASLADLVVITDDNPRSEDPAAIRAAIRAGTATGSATIIEIDGRRAAIQHAIEAMRAGDVIVIAGKGHEQGQVFADHVEPFDDMEEARLALAGAKGAAYAG